MADTLDWNQAQVVPDQPAAAPAAPDWSQAQVVPEPVAPPSFLARAADGVKYMASKFAEQPDFGAAEKAFAPEHRATFASLGQAIDESPTLGALADLGTVEVPTGTEGKKRVQAFDVPNATRLAVAMGSLPLLGPEIVGGATSGLDLLANAGDLGLKMGVGEAGSRVADRAIDNAFPGDQSRHIRFLRWAAEQGMQLMPFMLAPHVTGGLDLRGKLEAAMAQHAAERPESPPSRASVDDDDHDGGGPAQPHVERAEPLDAFEQSEQRARAKDQERVRQEVARGTPRLKLTPKPPTEPPLADWSQAEVVPEAPAANAATELPGALGGAAAAMRDNLADKVYQRATAGDVSLAQEGLLEQAALHGVQRGIIKSREDFDRVADHLRAHGETPENAAAALNSLTPAPSAPGAAEPATATPEAPVEREIERVHSVDGVTVGPKQSMTFDTELEARLNYLSAREQPGYLGSEMVANKDGTHTVTVWGNPRTEGSLGTPPAPEAAPAGEKPAEPVPEPMAAMPEPKPTAEELKFIGAKVAEAQAAPTTHEALEKVPDAPAGGIATTLEGSTLAALEAAPWANIKLIPTDLFEADPERFQFKLEHGEEGQSGSFTEDTKYNPEMVGVGTAYYDPATDKLHPVNMHNRLWLAKKDHAPYLPVKVIDGGNSIPWAAAHNASAGDARALGALQNIAEGRGNAVDAAQYLRDAHATIEQMKAIGLNLSNKMVSEAQGLQQLDEGLWQLVKLKAVEADKAAILGQEIPDDPAAQRMAFNWLKEKADTGKTVTQEFTRDMAQQFREAGSRPEDTGQAGDQIGLPGTEKYLRKSLFEEQAAVIGGVKADLLKQRNAFGNAVRNAAKLEAAGNTIVAEQNRALAAAADARLKELKRWLHNPQMKQIVREAAEQLDKTPRDKPTIIKNAGEALGLAADQAAALAPLDAPPPQMTLAGQDEQTGALFKTPEGATLTSEQAAAKTREPGFSLGGGFPGGKQLVEVLEQEGRYHSAKMAQRGKGLVTYLRKLLAPQTLGPHAARTGEIYIEAAGERAAKSVSDEVALAPLRKFMAEVPGGWRGKYEHFYAAYERGEMPDVPAEQRPLVERIRRAYEQRRTDANRLRELRGRRPIARLENYLSHLYADEPAKVQDYFQGTVSSTGRPLTGGTPFTHQRKYLDYMDAIRGGGLTPRYENPIDQIMAGLKQYDKYIMAETMFRNLDDAGLLRFFRPGQIPAGWKKIDDGFFHVRQPTDEGLLDRGDWAAPEEAAQVLNNQLRPVPEALEPFVKLVGPGSGLARINAMRVGFSAYHFVNVNNAMMAQTQGIGAARMLHGLATLDGTELANGLHLFGRGLDPLPEPWTGVGALYEAFASGDKIMRALIEPGTQGEDYDQAVKAAIMGGMRIKPEQVGTLGKVVGDAFREVLHPLVENRPAGELQKPIVTRALGRFTKGVFDTVDATSAALMHYYIPRIKLGAFYRLASQELNYNEAKTGGVLPYVVQRKILQDVSAHVDSLFGQMVDDNLFMGRSIKTALHLFIGYPSWNIGSARLAWNASKGVFRLAVNPSKLLAGEIILNSQERLALHFAGGLISSQMIQNAILMRLLTGLWPHSIQDFFQPQDGGKDGYGNPTRITPPSYMRTFISAGTHPTHWINNVLNFYIGTVRDLAENKQAWSGRQVVDPTAPLDKQLEQLGVYLGGAVMPFAVSNIGRLRESASGPRIGTGPARYGREALGAVGYTPTPAEFTRTKAENYVISTAGENVPHHGLNEQEYARRQTRIAMADALRNGKPLDPAKFGSLKQLTPANRQIALQEAVKEAKYPRIVGLMRSLTLPQVLHTYELARDSGDKKNLAYARLTIQDKFARADPVKLKAQFDEMDDGERDRYRAILRDALGLPAPARGTAETQPES